ncbi:MAG: PorV/PorQ family protein [Candidatus Fermentibacteraceae bacterium]
MRCIKAMAPAVLTALLLALPMQAEEPYRDAGISAFAFLKIGVGARASALGGTGSVNGGSLSLFGNPAGMASMDASSFTAGYNSWLGSTSQTYAASAFRSGPLVWGAGASMLGSGEMERREGATTDPLGTFASHEMTFNAAGALRLGRFDLGLGAKMIYQRIWLRSCTGFALDGGVVYRPADSLRLAAVLANIGPEVTMTDESHRLPWAWKTGGRWAFGLRGLDMAVSAEARKYIDSRLSWGAGAEVSPTGWAHLRGGWMFEDECRSLTAGLGLEGMGWGLDYSYVPADFALGDSHTITLSRRL